MPMNMSELIEHFGAASERDSGVLFVGAGLSQAVGLPGWSDLIDELRLEAGVPSLEDAPLMAEYIAHNPHIGRERLNTHVLDQIVQIEPHTLSPVHEHLARLRVHEIWTTNYDQLLEMACQDAVTVFDEDHVHNAGTRPRTIVKMHGSACFGPPPRWDALPVLTRGDYERYEDEHRRMWTMLQAVYLSKTILFVGFSFTDPNVELLHKLSRRYGLANGNRHLAIMCPPHEPEPKRRYSLQRDDLERSGIKVAEIDKYSDLEGVFRDLEVRTRRPKLFISGSSTGGKFENICKVMAEKLEAEEGWEIASLGGQAGWWTSKQLAALLRAKGSYDPSRIEIYFRQKDEPAPPLDTRLGTAIYSNLERKALVKSVLQGCRAMLVIGGGPRTVQEIDWARELGVGVVPLPTSSGTAHTYYDKIGDTPPQLGSAPASVRTWHNLGSNNLGVACSAASELLRQAMYQARS